MHRIRYYAYYDTPNGRPKRDFGPDKGAAIAWAKAQPGYRNTEVVAVTTETVWSPSKGIE